jgi:hypothetical protein
MKHLNDEELIEHYYGKDPRQHSFGEDRDAGDAARHIASCAECGANYTALQADLSDLAGFNPPLRDAEYGQRVWESIARLLPERPERRQLWMRLDLWRGLAYAAAAAVLLAATFYAGRIWEHSRAPLPTAKSPASAPAPKQVVVVVMSDYLDRSERLLVVLKHTDADDSDMLPPLRDEARNLLPANRICQREAEKSDDPELEKTLNALDRLLAELADQPGDFDPAAVMRLQKEMNADGLLFEVRVLRSRIPATEQARGTASEGGKI